MNANHHLRMLSTLGGMALLAALPVTALAQQSMKVSDGGMSNGKLIMLGECGPLVVKAPSSNQRSANKQATTKAKPDLVPGIDAVWQVVSPGVINYCVRAGVVNNGNAASAAPWTLRLADTRSANDPSYADEHSAAGKPAPSAHPAAPARVGSGAQPVPAGSIVTLGDTWCVTNLRWEKRPRLQLTLTAPSTGTDAQTIACKVDIKDEKRVLPRGNILTALGGNAIVIDASATSRPSPTSVPAQKVLLPKGLAPK